MTVSEDKLSALREERGTTATAPRLGVLSRRLLVAALVLLAAGLGVKTAASAATAVELFLYPFQFDESEGMIVAETMLLDQGVNIYDPVTPDLFISAPYPPLYYLLVWPGQHLLGDEPSFKVGRAITLLATLSAGLLLYSIIIALTRDKLAGVVSALAWWSVGLVAYWGSLVKPDMLAITFGLGGIWWLLARPPSQLWWSLLFFLAAFYTKQTAIAAAGAAVLWLLLTRPRTGLAFGAAYAAGAVLPSLLLNWLTDGGYYYHIVTLHLLPSFWVRYVEYTTAFLQSYGPFVVVGSLSLLAAGGAWLVGRRRRDIAWLPRDGGLLLPAYLFLSLYAAIGVSTHGGNHNHFLEWTAAACLGLGLATAYARRLASWHWRLGAGLVALFLLLFVPPLFPTPHFLSAQLGQLAPKHREGMWNIFQYVTNDAGNAYSDNVGLLLTARKKLWTTDPFTQTHATFYGRWDESKLVAAIREKQFSQVILRIDVRRPDAGAGDVSPGILQAVRDSYKLDQANVENIYVPR